MPAAPPPCPGASDPPGDETTRGPGNNDSNPRPNARRFSTFSFSPATFSTAAVFVMSLPQSVAPLHHRPSPPKTFVILRRRTSAPKDLCNRSSQHTSRRPKHPSSKIPLSFRTGPKPGEEPVFRQRLQNPHHNPCPRLSPKAPLSEELPERTSLGRVPHFSRPLREVGLFLFSPRIISTTINLIYR